MRINNDDKWTLFDEYAMKAADAHFRWLSFNSSKQIEYDNKITDPGMISGNVWPNWTDEDRRHNRKLLALAYDAQDRALRMRPRRVHVETTRNRLRSFLEL